MTSHSEPSAPSASRGRRSVDEHAAAVRDLLRPLLDRLERDAVTVPLAEARGRVLARPVIAPLDLPPFDNSQMDGYAVRSADVPGPLTAVATIAAGHAEAALAPESGPRSAAPIMTGAMMPAWADAVVPVEAAEPPRFVTTGEEVTLPGAPAGQFVRARGSDVARGTTVLDAGARLGAPQIALLAALGLVEVPVREALRVAVVSTGDELVQAGEALPPGRIYDSNGPMLAAALDDAGARVSLVQAQEDSPEGLRATLSRLDGVDLVVSTGGISQGAFEVVKQGLEDGVEFVSVALQPGGPQALGAVTIASGPVPFLGFPGNPVSSLVSFEMFLRPLLAGPRPSVRAVLEGAADSPTAKHQVRRGILRDGRVRLEGGAGSHLLHALAQADCLVHLPVGLDRADDGAEVEVWIV
ncbi:molybdopterin molybdotransferase [Arthrobacter woluwensis]|uniref:molybdopterin molybdotransferase MoeA n=1 Tax=Arthrobacter woluwensis TaxID=156980 RepID=UPI00277DED2A|nr:gephyrin-like molybdotransferase Glp [Arthrobacter woluwensis]MDQ0708259.1 molybdopterin molybdotransferase [Arthrobacter woluwensis]